jgi:hypothetical protein
MKAPSLGVTDNFPNREMWKEIAEELHGEFKISYDSSNAIEIHTIYIPYKKWKIHISVSDTRPLKFQISFSAGQDFEMILSWEDFIEGILKKFRKPETEIGWKVFDDHYLIESNRPDLVKKTITREIQEIFLKYDVYSLTYQTNISARTAELTGVIQRKAGGKKMILELVDTFKLLIDHLQTSRIIT